MAKQTESTAVNALIDLVSRGGSQELPTEDLFATAPRPLPRARKPQGTDRNVPVVPAFATARVRTAPPARGVSIPPVSKRVNQPPAFVVREDVPAPPERPSMQTTTLPVALPSAAPYEPTPRDSDKQYAGRGAREGTQQITRRTRLDPRRFAIPMVLFFIVGGAIGGYIAVKQRRSNNAVAVGRLAPDAGPVVMVEPPTPTPPPPSDMLIRTPAAFTEVRIDTVPSGASVTLVDNGTQMPLGSTPLSATVETARQYELRIAHPSFATQTIALDPQATQHIKLPLAAVAPVKPVTARVPTPAPPVVTAPVATTARTKPTPAPAPVQAPKAKRPAPVAKASEPVAAASRGEGTLMISAKPPCEIAIDGKATGLTTPQRSIALAAGSHKVTLTNITAGIRETFAVKITPGSPTKVIRDLMPR